MHAAAPTQVAEVLQLRGCFGAKKGARPVLPVYNAADAATHAQATGEAVLWLDLEAQTLNVTQWWRCEAETQQLAVRINVDLVSPRPADHVAEEVVVAMVEFLEPPAHMLHLVQALLQWNAIRRDAAGCSLLVCADHWLISQEHEALLLRLPDASCAGRLQLLVHDGRVELQVLEGADVIRTCAVSSLHDAAKLLSKHSKPMQRLDRAVHATIKGLQPSPASSRHLLHKLQAAANNARGAASMSQWCRGGVVAAIMDCACNLVDSDQQEQQHEQRQHWLGHLPLQQHQQQQHKKAAPAPPATRFEVQQCLAECCEVVLLHAAPAAQQTRQLLSCVGASLAGSQAHAVAALQLLALLQHTGSPAVATAVQLQAARDTIFLELLQQRYDSTLAAHQPAGNPGGTGNGVPQQEAVSSHAGGAAADPDHALDELSASCSLTEQQSQAPAARRHPAVPRLALPSLLGASSPVGSSRLLQQYSNAPTPSTATAATAAAAAAAAAAAGACEEAATDAAADADSDGEPGRLSSSCSSAVKALQQLGQACGQGVVAAEVAAFVAHKQLLLGSAGGGGGSSSGAAVAAGPGTRSPRAGGDVEDAADGTPLTSQQVARLPLKVQLQLLVLQCLQRLLHQLPPHSSLPVQLAHQLLGQLLQSRAQWGQACRCHHAPADAGLLDSAYRRARHVALQALQACTAGKPQADALAVHRPPALHNSMLERFKQRLAQHSSSSNHGMDAAGHAGCGELLALLAAFLRVSPRALADTACNMLAGELVRQEHVLRAVRMAHWSWAAMQHMDGLVQVYAALLTQASAVEARVWLLKSFGVIVAASMAQGAVDPAGSSSSSSCGGSTAAAGVRPCPTLQLVLDFLLKQLTRVAAAVTQGGSSVGGWPATAAAAAAGAAAAPCTPSRGGAAGGGRCPLLTPKQCAAAWGSSGGSSSSSAVRQQDGSLTPVSARSAVRNAAHMLVAAGLDPHSRVVAAQLAGMKAHCWQLLAALLRLAAAAGELAGAAPPSPLGSSRSASRVAGTPHRQPHADAAAPCSSPGTHLSAPGSSARDGRPVVPKLALQGALLLGGGAGPSSAGSSPRGRGSVVLSPHPRRPMGDVVVDGGRYAPGRCPLWQLLVDTLMVHSRAGQAVVLQQLSDTQGGQLQLPLQQEVAAFISTALGVPGAYPFSRPQLAEFFVHHHFLHFTQQYHRLPSCPSAAAARCCLCHMQVLLALCCQTCGASLVRRRFLQLKVLEFLTREASLEHLLQHRQLLAGSPSSSSCSTPLATSRGPDSGSAAAACADDRDSPAAGGGSGGGRARQAVLPLALPLPAAGASARPQLSARGTAASRLSISSPGCVPLGAGAARASHAGSSLVCAARFSADDAAPALTDAARSSTSGSRLAAAAGKGSLHTQARDTGAPATPVTAAARAIGAAAVAAVAAAAVTAAAPPPTALAAHHAAAEEPAMLPAAAEGHPVKSAVKAFEAAAAAALSPPPPVIRRRPGKRLAVGAVGGAAALLLRSPAPAAAAAACAPVRSSIGLPVQQQQQQQQQQHQQQQQQQPGDDSSQVRLPHPPQAPKLAGAQGLRGTPPQVHRKVSVPKLGLPSSGGGSSSSSSSSGGGGAQQGGVPLLQLPVPHAHPSTTQQQQQQQQQHEELSPRAQLGLAAPRSMVSARRVTPPTLTGDASLDNELIEEWEAATGMVFAFDGLSNASSGSSGRSAPDAGSPRSARTSSSASSSSECGDGSAEGAPAAAQQQQQQHRQQGGVSPLSAPAAQPALGTAVPLLSLRLGSLAGRGSVGSGAFREPAAAGAAAAATLQQLCMRNGSELSSPASSYKPGWDLEEDLERLMAEEEEAAGGSGSDGCWGYSSDDEDGAASRRSSSCSSTTTRSPSPRTWQALPAQQQQAQHGDACASPDRASQGDTQVHDDTSVPGLLSRSSRAAARCSPAKQAKQQATISSGTAGSSRRAVAHGSPVAHALVDEDWGPSASEGDSREQQQQQLGDDYEEGSCSECSEGPAFAGATHQTWRSPPRSGAGALRVPKLRLPGSQQAPLHLPMAAAVAPLSAGGNSSRYSASGATARSSTAGTASPHLLVTPLATARTLGHASHATLTPNSGRGGSSGGGAAGLAAHTPLARRLHSTAGALASVQEAGVAAVDGDAGGTSVGGGRALLSCAAGTPLDPQQACYAAQVQRSALYMVPELHVACLQLALHLLVTPAGLLDALQLPHEPSDTSLQRKVLLLLEHLSHSGNAAAVGALVRRARQAALAPAAGTACPGGCASSSKVPTPAGAGRALPLSAAELQQVCSRAAAAAGGAGCMACGTQRGPSGSGGGGGPGSSCGAWEHSSSSAGACGSPAAAPLTQQAAVAGLACSTLRLVKLLCAGAFDAPRLSLGSMLSKGAFSEVMAGTWQQPGADPPSRVAVAVKVMDVSEDDASCFERVYNEVAVLELMHGQPGIVPLLEYGLASSSSGSGRGGGGGGQRQWLLVFPQYERSLRDWRLQWRGRGLDARDLPAYLHLFVQVALSVARLHAAGVVHCDIKGDNVLLPGGYDPAAAVAGSGGVTGSSTTATTATSSSSGSGSGSSGPGVVLADFGDALRLAGDAHASSQRHRGTELFSSPEMLLLHAGRQHAAHAQHDRRRHRGVGAPHDVWSLGCTLYELLTGSVLFEDEGVGRITSYGSSQSSGGGSGATGAAPTPSSSSSAAAAAAAGQGGGRAARSSGSWGVLNQRERAALGGHAAAIELVEAMLVREPSWRPAAEQVAARAQRLLDALP